MGTRVSLLLDGPAGISQAQFGVIPGCSHPQQASEMWLSFEKDKNSVKE